jgi:peroxiredoxin
MKKNIFIFLGVAVVLASSPKLIAQAAATGTPPAPAAATPASGAEAEFKALMPKIQAKIQSGKKTEADMADELKEFDAILEKHKSEKTDAVANVLFMKAMLYSQVFDDMDKATKMIEQLKKDFPDTNPGKNADKTLEGFAKQAEAKKIQKSLAEGTRFPDFDEKDVAGKSFSIANYKGKVVLVDFWATWCGPCVQELPNVLNAYEKYHAKGFEIVGISLDKDESKLTTFTTDRKMPWQQFFDGKMWQNKLAVKYGINSIPATYLLDGEGKIIARNLRGEALDEALAKALATK